MESRVYKGIKNKIKKYGKKLITAILLIHKLHKDFQNNLILDSEYEKRKEECIDENFLTSEEINEIEKLRDMGYYSKLVE